MLKKFTSEPAPHISEFAREFDFETLRPHYDSEVKEVMARITADPLYFQLMSYLWKGITLKDAVKKAETVTSLYDFQTNYMSHAIWTIVKGTSAGLTWSGIENLDPNKAYLYIANHRDILLDSAILQIILEAENFATSEITFGSNLMEQGFITDFGRMNRMFTVKREGNAKEMYDISRQLSAYIRHTILDKNTSVWIAQRNGRTKDGNDQTQTGLLKMLNMSGDRDFVKSFSQLNIVPLTISFEYEPCDALKVQELYLSSLHTKYVKAPGEDINSIVTGITQPKGKIHMAFGKPIQQELHDIEKACSNENEKIKTLTALIDKRIHHDYKLNHVNYIAYDLLHDTNVFADMYAPDEKDHFIIYVENHIKKLSGEEDALRQLFLKMYAAPVENRLNLK
ncbi:MAG: 1-acyl-sn-glycerol-3-phosphate acyltransferase [Bacteroidetes bacterium]|nr:1-acyl-sn-glycerol-3-phosphate acyltransferase [Bacteroidota bacterium]